MLTAKVGNMPVGATGKVKDSKQAVKAGVRLLLLLVIVTIQMHVMSD